METIVVRKPEEREIPNLVDAECLYYEPRSASGMCTAPPGHKCPYRQYGETLPTAQTEVVKYGHSAGVSKSPSLQVSSNRMRSRPRSDK
jgi:hypothetical protein